MKEIQQPVIGLVTALLLLSILHKSAPLQLADGTWRTIGQSYEKYGNDDWSG